MPAHAEAGNNFQARRGPRRRPPRVRCREASTTTGRPGVPHRRRRSPAGARDLPEVAQEADQPPLVLLVPTRSRTRFRSPSCDALRIRGRSRCTFSVTGRHTIASQSKSSSRGPFTSSGSDLSASTSDANVRPRHILARPVGGTSATLTSPGTTRYPASCPQPTAEGGMTLSTVSCRFRPPALASWAILFPPGRSAFLKVSPPGATARNPNGVTRFRMRETRPGRVPHKPRGGGCSRDRTSARFWPGVRGVSGVSAGWSGLMGRPAPFEVSGPSSAAHQDFA